MKLLVISILILILTSLSSALFYLFSGKGNRNSVAKALTLRIGMSIGLFGLLMLGYYFGLLGNQHL